jgi:ketosteroid isomerase-like protein
MQSGSGATSPNDVPGRTHGDRIAVRVSGRAPLAAGDTGRAMSQENVEIVRRAWEYEMFGRGGEDAVADFASDIVMNPVEEAPSYGRAAIRDNIHRFESAWEDLQVTAEQFIDAGDRVFVTAHFRGRGRASGITVETRLYEVYTLRDHKVVRVDEFTDRDEALEALGLRE